MSPQNNHLAPEESVDFEKSSWETTFSLLDKDGSGDIDKDELKAGLVALGQPSSDEDIAMLLEEAGISSKGDGNISINLDQFIRIIEQSSKHCSKAELSENDLVTMFNAIDLDASQYITTAELQHFLSNLGMFLTDEKMSEMLRMYDQDGDGRIVFEEFSGIVEDLGFKIVKDDPEVLSRSSRLGSSKRSNIVQRAEQGYMQQIIDLDSIENEDLRNALAPFDKLGCGTIDLGLVRQAAEGKTPPKLHWSENRPMIGLAKHIKSVNHIAILVSDVSRSIRFYKNVMGFEQIRRPNFDSHGAWFTIGNCELHLIKGKPVVHEGDDLVVGHISIDADDINGVLPKLKELNVEFRKNTSVPAGADAGTMNTNANNDMNSDKIVTQYFIRDPDGYYLEICNCNETLTKYCLGEKDTLPGYAEGIQSLSLAAASSTLNLIQRWLTKLDTRTDRMEVLTRKVKETNGSIKAVAALVGSKRAETVNEKVLSTLLDRRSIYGDICQNEEEEDMEEILLEAGNSSQIAETIIKLRSAYRGKTIYRPPAVFRSDGTKYMPKAIEKLH